MAKAKKKQNRRAMRRQRYEPQITPTHFIRLTRLKITVDPNRRWYVVRLGDQREQDVERGLRAAGFSTYRAIERDLVARNGRTATVERRLIPGYLFVGVEKAEDGRALLWAHYEAVMARQPPMTVQLEIPHKRRVDLESHVPPRKPFVRVMGPFAVSHLQRFVDRLEPPHVAVLWAGGEPVFTFPAKAARIVEGEVVHLAEPVAA